MDRPDGSSSGKTWSHPEPWRSILQMGNKSSMFLMVWRVSYSCRIWVSFLCIYIFAEFIINIFNVRYMYNVSIFDQYLLWMLTCIFLMYFSYIYWTDWSTEKLERAALDGTMRETIRTQIGQVHGLTIDYGGKRLYWTSINQKVIASSDLNGKKASLYWRKWKVTPSLASFALWRLEVKKKNCNAKQIFIFYIVKPVLSGTS